jgi:hypothetical protein
MKQENISFNSAELLAGLLVFLSFMLSLCGLLTLFVYTESPFDTFFHVLRVIAAIIAIPTLTIVSTDVFILKNNSSSIKIIKKMLYVAINK